MAYCPTEMLASFSSILLFNTCSFREIKLGQHVVERTDLPDELITQVAGITLFAQEFPRVSYLLFTTLSRSLFVYQHCCLGL